MSDGRLTNDPWAHARRHTAARIALGRAGGSLPTRELLKFSLDHAAARDAVHTELDLGDLEAKLFVANLPIVRVSTLAPDRTTYLQRPDRGRAITPESREVLQQVAGMSSRGFDLAIIIADGLSALATQTHVPALIRVLIPKLRQAGIQLAPLVLVQQARVAVQDEIGVHLGARASLILLGERPGLGAADSLGAYLVFDPKPGNTDADRNCISNIRPAGLSIPLAAETLTHLITESIRLKISGVNLKDERAPLKRIEGPNSGTRNTHE